MPDQLVLSCYVIGPETDPAKPMTQTFEQVALFPAIVFSELPTSTTIGDFNELLDGIIELRPDVVVITNKNASQAWIDALTKACRILGCRLYSATLPLYGADPDSNDPIDQTILTILAQDT